jgi:hypothetical protein
MRINFELNTENENPSMLQATAAYLNNLANINAGTAIEPVHGFLEPGEVDETPKGGKPVTEPKNDFKKESIAESIAAVKEQLAAEKEETEKDETEKDETKKEEPKKPARRRAKTAPEVKTEPEPETDSEQVKEPEQPKEQPKEQVTIEQAKAVAMKALNKGRREVVKDAFRYVGASSFPTLAPENFADFIKYIEENL